MSKHKPPFPWFGGKSRVADLVWRRFGNVPNYVEPFFGSGAVLFLRPHEPRIETVNDLDCYLANFWRALQTDPDAVTRWADWPVNEADLHARHWWLVRQDGFREKMRRDPDYHDAKIAGWWVWGICQWIGSGWCKILKQQRPHLRSAGMGVRRLDQKRPDLRHWGRGVHDKSRQNGNLHAYMRALSDRLRKVRVCCGDWTRVLGTTPTEKNGLTGVFLDPPYQDDMRRDGLYAVDQNISNAVRDWAVAHGDNLMLRIALCGYEGEHEMPADWECVAWKTHGGYGSQRKNGDNENSHKERIWFSPHCLKIERTKQLSLLEVS